MTDSSNKFPLTSHSAKPLKGRISLPGDKSISHRSLMLGTLAVGKTRIENLLESEDVLRTASAMQSFGGVINRDENGIWNVYGVGVGSLCESATHLDFGNSGTGARLVMGIAGSHPVSTTFTGDESLAKRPMARVLEPLRNIGAEVICREGERLPLSIRGPETALAQTYRVPVPSAQVKSAVLLAGMNAPGITTVVEPIPTRDHTERMLSSFGVDVKCSLNENNERIIEIEGQQELSAQKIVVPGDPSSAAFLLVAALLIPDSELTIENMLYNEHRTGLITTLLEMDANIEIQNERLVSGESVVDVKVCHSQLTGNTVPPDRAPSMIDEYPILAIAASFAKGETRMEGLKELRVKESDRLAAIADGLKRNGVSCHDDEETLTIAGGKSDIGGGTVAAHFDHRIAMSFLIMGLVAKKPVTVDDTTPISTSFPNFIRILEDIGSAEFEPPENQYDNRN